jgi:cyclic beta-1,2-glucan synthetase
MASASAIVTAIEVENPHGAERGVVWVELDGQRVSDGVIRLEKGLVTHRVVVRMGNPGSTGVEAKTPQQHINA